MAWVVPRAMLLSQAIGPWTSSAREGFDPLGWRCHSARPLQGCRQGCRPGSVTSCLSAGSACQGDL